MKASRVQLLVVMPHVSSFDHVPGGLIYLSDMMDEADLRERVDVEDADVAWLRELLKTIKRRLGRRVSIRLVDPMTLAGLFIIVRYRIRRYPAVVTPAGRMLLQPSVEDVIQRIAEELRSIKE